jgi:capsular polysaccharide biosynthesis protein
MTLYEIKIIQFWHKIGSIFSMIVKFFSIKPNYQESGLILVL